MEPTVRRWVPVIVIGLAILVGSILPVPAAATRPVGPLGLDLWLHALGFACLTVTVVLAIGPSNWAVPRSLLLVTGAILGYGVAIELIQLALPYRRFAVADVVADAAGTLVVVTVWWLRRRRP